MPPACFVSVLVSQVQRAASGPRPLQPQLGGKAGCPASPCRSRSHLPWALLASSTPRRRPRRRPHRQCPWTWSQKVPAMCVAYFLACLFRLCLVLQCEFSSAASAGRPCRIVSPRPALWHRGRDDCQAAQRGLVLCRLQLSRRQRPSWLQTCAQGAAPSTPRSCPPGPCSLRGGVQSPTVTEQACRSHLELVRQQVQISAA